MFGLYVEARSGRARTVEPDGTLQTEISKEYIARRVAVRLEPDLRLIGDLMELRLAEAPA